MVTGIKLRVKRQNLIVAFFVFTLRQYLLEIRNYFLLDICMANSLCHLLCLEHLVFENLKVGDIKYYLRFGLYNVRK